MTTMILERSFDSKGISDRFQEYSLEPDLFAELEQFIATSDLPHNVKDTARRKLADPTLSWETIAQNSTPPVVTSTA
ncbi:hypothetical protein [Rhodococcus globerulus]|nr:hypothetical protein [Rhodococcus globerulus]NMD59801.1 LNG1/LNG2 family protein [Nocardia globerula]